MWFLHVIWMVHPSLFGKRSRCLLKETVRLLRNPAERTPEPQGHWDETRFTICYSLPNHLLSKTVGYISRKRGLAFRALQQCPLRLRNHTSLSLYRTWQTSSTQSSSYTVFCLSLSTPYRKDSKILFNLTSSRWVDEIGKTHLLCLFVALLSRHPTISMLSSPKSESLSLEGCEVSEILCSSGKDQKEARSAKTPPNSKEKQHFNPPRIRRCDRRQLNEASIRERDSVPRKRKTIQDKSTKNNDAPNLRRSKNSFSRRLRKNPLLILAEMASLQAYQAETTRKL